MKIGIGTAQFGMNYGITNQVGQVSNEEIQKIFLLANQANIHFIDTASGYGDSEKNLGNLINVDEYNVVTKIPKLSIPKSSNDSSEGIKKNIQNSFSNLNAEKLYAVLFHDTEQLIENPHLWEKLLSVKNTLKIHKIGVSVYHPEQVEKLWSLQIFPELVQCPYNIFDQRFETTGLFEKMKSRNVEIHIRSIFLQGLLIATNTGRLKLNPELQFSLEAWDDFFVGKSYSKKDLCISFVKKNTFVDVMIVGVTSRIELEEILFSKEIDLIDVSQFQNISERVINPSKWN